MLFGAFLRFLACKIVKPYRKKQKYKTGLITSFILLLYPFKHLRWRIVFKILCNPGIFKPGSHQWENEFLTEFFIRNCIFPLMWTHFDFSLTISQWYSRVKFSEKNIKTLWYFSHWISQDQRFRLAHRAYTSRNVQKKLIRNQNIRKNDIRRDREREQRAVKNGKIHQI